MTDNLLQKIEEKVVVLLSELEALRAEAFQLRQENAVLKSAEDQHKQKLQGLVSLLDMLETAPANLSKASDNLVSA